MDQEANHHPPSPALVCEHTWESATHVGRRAGVPGKLEQKCRGAKALEEGSVASVPKVQVCVCMCSELQGTPLP